MLIARMERFAKIIIVVSVRLMPIVMQVQSVKKGSVSLGFFNTMVLIVGITRLMSRVVWAIVIQDRNTMWH